MMVIVADVWCILFWVQLIAFVGIIICLVCWYDSELKEAERKTEIDKTYRELEIFDKDMTIQKLKKIILTHIVIEELGKSKKKQ